MATNRLVFPAGSTVELRGFAPPQPGPGEVLIRTRSSLISTGTEGIVFARRFDPGTHWDQWVKYPFFPGYASVGVIEAVGSGVPGDRIGQRVACRGGHASHHVRPAKDAFPVPDALPDDHALWFALAKIAFMGARAAELRIGDSVAVIGAGPVGQMALRWVRALGARHLVVIDSDQARLEHARNGGATATVAGAIDGVRDQILAACGGKAPRVVIDSTGNAAVFASALRLVANRGRVVILGDTGSPATQHLTSDVITRGLTITAAHDCHTDEQWHDASITDYVFDLATAGRFPLAGLVGRLRDPRDCQAVYDELQTRRTGTMGVAFDWTLDLGQQPLGDEAAIIPGRAAPASAT